MAASEGHAAYAVTLSLDITVIPNDNIPADLLDVAKQKPLFRYSFLNGQRVTTAPPSIGAAGWERVVLASDNNGATDAAAGKAGKDAKAAKPDVKAKVPGKPSTADANEGAVPGGPILLRHSTRFDVKGDRDFAKTLHEQPCVYVMLGTQPDAPSDGGGGSAKGAAAGKGAAPAATASQASASGTGSAHPFVAFVPLDCSPLLADAPAVSALFGSREAAIAALQSTAPRPATSDGTELSSSGVSSSVSVDLAAALGCPMPANQPSLACPLYFSFLHIAVRVVAATQTKVVEALPVASPSAAGATVAAGKGGKPDPKAAAAAAKGPETVTVPITPPRLLCSSLRREVNPLTLTFLAADGLPGLILPEGSDASMKRFIQPDAFQLQRRLCRPTYAVMRLPSMASGATSSSATGASTGAALAVLQQRYEVDEAGTVITVPAPRASTLITPALTPGSALSLHYSTVICAGLMDAQALREALRTQPLSVEVHDRDCIRYEAIQQAAKVAALKGTSSLSKDNSSSNSGSRATTPAVVPQVAAAAPATPASPAKPAAGRDPKAALPDPSAVPPTTAAAAQAPVSQLPSFLSAVLPASWPWPLLPASRVEWFENVASGAAAWPSEITSEGAGSAATSSSSRPTTAASTAAPVSPGRAAKAATPASGTSSSPPPKTVFDVDALMCAEAMHRASTSGDGHAHAQANVKLDGLLDRQGERRALLKAKWYGGSNNNSSKDVAQADPSPPAAATAAAASGGLVVQTAPAGGAPSSASSPRPDGSATARSTTMEADDGNGEEPIKLRLNAGLSAVNRRVKPKIPVPMHLLSYEESLVIAPGCYGASGARVKVAVEIACPSRLHPTPVTAANAQADEPPFERLIVAFDYRNDELLQALINAVERVNSEALPRAASARSHVLSPSEVASANDGVLDIVTGVHVIDGGLRILVLEGLADTGGASSSSGSGSGGRKAMSRVRDAIGPRGQVNDGAFTLLHNPSVRFHNRLYTQFNCMPKDIRLRAPLHILCDSPLLYDVQRVPASVREALVSLSVLVHTAGTMATAKQSGQWPTAEGLLGVENKYGNTVSLADMYGMNHPAAHALEETRGRLGEALTLAAGHVNAATNDEMLLAKTLDATTGRLMMTAHHDHDVADDGSSLSLTARRRQRMTLKGGTTSLNTAYYDALRQQAEARAAADFIATNIAAVDAKSAALTAKKHNDLAATVGPDKANLLLSLRPGETIDTAGQQPPGGQVYLYSGQKLNTGEWQKDQMRARLAADKKSTYSYGREYGSLTVSLVDVDGERQAARAREMAARMTASGFVYPSHKSRAEDAVHPHKPSQQRIDDLQGAWADPNDMAARERAISKAAETLVGDRPVFASNPEADPLRGVGATDGCFGYTDPRDHRTQLGNQYFKTVHLCGDGLETEVAEARRREYEEWRGKIVTGTTKFLSFSSHDGLAKVNRIHGMLRNEPRKAALRHLRDGDPRHGSALPSGKPVPYANAPVSIDIAPGLHYEPPTHPEAGITKSVSASHKLGWTATTSDGRPLDFKRVGPRDVVTGTAKHVYKPSIEAALRPNGPIGGRPVLPTIERGINTDAAGAGRR